MLCIKVCTNTWGWFLLRSPRLVVLKTRRRRPTRCQFLLCLFTRESPFGGVCIHMQYIIHGLYFMKRNNENDRFLFPWCQRSTQHAARSTQQHTWYDHYTTTSPHHSHYYFYTTSTSILPSTPPSLSPLSSPLPQHHFPQ